MKLEKGALVAGKYRLERRIGAGGMGEVWAATQTVTRKPVALKFLRDAEADPDTKRRFLREARAACAVRHPNVVEVHDVLELDDGAPVMVMELLEGESLEDRLKRDGKLALGDLAAVLVRVVSAVGTAHALGIVHRDLKPDNIFLAKTPDGVEVKVLDFGIAKLTALEGDAALTGGLTNTGAMLGTPYYMSPEQAFGEKKVDHRADVWSLGIILYRGISGVLPTKADNIGQILKIVMTHAIPPIGEVAPSTPSDVVELVGRMLAQSPADRPSDLREVKAVLERYAGVVVEEFSAPAAQPDSVASTTTDGGLASRSAPSLATAAPPPGRGRAIAGGIMVVAALAMAALVLGRRGRQDTAAAASSHDASAPAPAALAVAPPSASPAPPASAEATAKPAAVAPTASASASASASARPRLGGPLHGPKPTATATSAPAPARTSIGGVVTQAPF
jgi:serine/threonine-protein kinase